MEKGKGQILNISEAVLFSIIIMKLYWVFTELHKSCGWKLKYFLTAQ